MEELSDKDFDQIFKNRIKDGYLEYEEESWLKMDKKLRSRDRFVFLRNASIILLFLSFGLGFYVISDKKVAIEGAKSTKIIKKENLTEGAKNEVLAKNAEDLIENHLNNTTIITKTKKRNNLSLEERSIAAKPEITSTTTPYTANQSKTINNSNVGMPNAIPDSSKVIAKNQVDLQQNAPIHQLQNAGSLIDISVSKSMAKHGITLSILVGPDFNSTENAIGGKSGMAVGIGVSVPIGRKLSVQTGLNYGSKKYEAQGYDYTFNNPNTVNIIAGIDASCKVLEIPLRTSYTVMENQKNSIDLSAGLSSYIMLKENYRFIYTAVSGRKDRFLEEKNANQHYLSVVDLSATYNIKLKNKKFALGIQPYVKIPISGIGEGNVPLKSSGISLKLNYELIKKK